MKAYAERGKMTNCDACVNYEYDEDYECYCCMVNLDEDNVGYIHESICGERQND